MNLEELYSSVDDFMQLFLPIYTKQLLSCGQRQRKRNGRMESVY